MNEEKAEKDFKMESYSKDKDFEGRSWEKKEGEKKGDWEKSAEKKDSKKHGKGRGKHGKGRGKGEKRKDESESKEDEDASVAPMNNESVSNERYESSGVEFHARRKHKHGNEEEHFFHKYEIPIIAGASALFLCLCGGIYYWRCRRKSVPISTGPTYNTMEGTHTTLDVETIGRDGTYTGSEKVQNDVVCE